MKPRILHNFDLAMFGLENEAYKFTLRMNVLKKDLYIIIFIFYSPYHTIIIPIKNFPFQ